MRRPAPLLLAAFALLAACDAQDRAPAGDRPAVEPRVTAPAVDDAADARRARERRAALDAPGAAARGAAPGARALDDARLRAIHDTAVARLAPLLRSTVRTVADRRRHVDSVKAALAPLVAAATVPPPDTLRPPPVDTVVTPPPPPDTGKRALVLAFLGVRGASIPTPAQVEAMGPAFALYESEFRKWEPIRHATDVAGLDGKPLWTVANYYDRAMVYYAWWARTGNPTYLARGHALLLDYRKNYVEANGYGLPVHWAFLDGLAIHYLLTGDEASRTAVGRIADDYTRSYYFGQLGDVAGETDNRIQARVLTAFLVANRIKAPHGPFSTGATAWADYARQGLTAILRTQSADGAYRMQFKQCGYNKPFFVGILNDALIRYEALLEPDPRIAPAVRRAVDYLWAKNWIAAQAGFTYLEGLCGVGGEHGGPGASGDLNLLIVNGFGHAFRHSGDPRYRVQGDSVWASGVRLAWFAGTKQFNEAFASSFRYPALRGP